MRKLGLVVAALALGAGCDHGTGQNNDHPDLSMGHGDGFVANADLSLADLSVPPDDLSVPDLQSTDMALPLDAMLFVSFTDYLDMLTAAICDQELRCGRITAARYDACRAEARQSLGVNFDADSEIAKSHLKVNAALCPPFRRSARCDGTDNGAVFDTGPCSSTALLIGELATGNACLSSRECNDGWCEHGDAGAGLAGCPGGLCVPFRPIDGGTAGGARSCSGSLTGSTECDPVGAYCTGGICTARPGLNDPCKLGVPCRLGTYCKGLIYDTSITSVCSAPPPTGTHDGDACDVGTINTTNMPPCASNLYCQHAVNDMGKPSTSGFCRAKKAAGDDCNPQELFLKNGNLIGNVCQDGTYCVQLFGETFGKCRAPAGTGGMCNPNADEFDFPGSAGCQDTFYCQDTGGGQGSCQPFQVPGTPCDPALPCLNPQAPGSCFAQPGQDAGVCLVFLRSWGDRCDPAVYNSNGVANECFLKGSCEPANNPAISRCVDVCP